MLTQERLKELLHYDPETGIFTRAMTWYKKAQGSKVGHHHNAGYLTVCIQSKTQYLHRLAFLYMEGYIPEQTIDHINGVRDDNRWCNLRHASVMCQRQNAARLSTNTTGYKGVTFNKATGLWGAQVIVNGEHFWLGSFDCPLEAALTRIVFEDWCPQWSCDARKWSREKVFADLKRAIETEDTSKWVYTINISKRNTTGYKGVKIDKKAKTRPYRAQVSDKGVRYHLGSFKTALEAVKARDTFITEKGFPIPLAVK